MKPKVFGGSIPLVSLFLATSAFAQELAPQFKKVKEGIFVYAE